MTDKDGWDKIAEQQKKRDRLEKVGKVGSSFVFIIELTITIVIIAIIVLALWLNAK